MFTRFISVSKSPQQPGCGWEAAYQNSKTLLPLLQLDDLFNKRPEQMPPKSNAAFEEGDAVEVHFGKMGWCIGSVISYDAINQEYEVFFIGDEKQATCHNSNVRGWVTCDRCNADVKTKTGVGPWPGDKPSKCRRCTKEEKANGRNQVATMPPKSRKVAEAGLPSPSDLSPDSKPQGKG
jgi:hypothetical protein